MTAKLYASDKEYMKTGGNICPVLACGGEDLRADRPQVDGMTVTVDVRCTTCGSTWVDVYKMIGYADLAAEE